MRFCYKLAILWLILPVTCYAGWPSFSVLSTAEIMHEIIKKGCAAGEGYIPTGTKIKIVSRYIPANQNWYWVYTGTNRCQKIPEQWHELKYMFYEQDGRYAGSTISTIYGTDNQGPLFDFSFTVPSEPEGWDCGPMAGHTPPTIIGCARDMK